MARGRTLDIAGRVKGGIRWNPALIFDPVFGAVYGPAGSPTSVYAGGVFGPDGFFLPAPLQFSEPWSEYAFTGPLSNLSNPPWQFSAGVTFSQPTHVGGAGDIHSDVSISRSDQFVGGLTYVQDSLQHVDVTKAMRIKWSQQFRGDATGFNNGMQMGVSIGPLLSVIVTCNASTAAATIQSSATGFVAKNYTEDFSVRSYQLDLGARDSGGAGKQLVTVRMNNVVQQTGTIVNANNGGGGAAFSFNPAFTQRLANQVFTLYGLKLYYTRI